MYSPYFLSAGFDPNTNAHYTIFTGIPKDVVSLSNLNGVSPRMYAYLEDTFKVLWSAGLRFHTSFDSDHILADPKSGRVYLIDYEGLMKIPPDVLGKLRTARGPTLVSVWSKATSTQGGDLKILKSLARKQTGVNGRSSGGGRVGRGARAFFKRGLGMSRGPAANSNGDGGLPPLKLRSVVATNNKSIQPRVFPENSSWGAVASLRLGGGENAMARLKSRLPRLGKIGGGGGGVGGGGGGPMYNGGAFAYNANNGNGNVKNQINGTDNNVGILAEYQGSNPVADILRPYLGVQSAFAGPVGNGNAANGNQKEQMKLPYNLKKTDAKKVWQVLENRKLVDDLVQQLRQKPWYMDLMKANGNYGKQSAYGNYALDEVVVYGIIMYVKSVLSALFNNTNNSRDLAEEVKKFVASLGVPEKPGPELSVWRKLLKTGGNQPDRNITKNIKFLANINDPGKAIVLVKQIVDKIAKQDPPVKSLNIAMQQLKNFASNA
jgi:hypothetical protein